VFLCLEKVRADQKRIAWPVPNVGKHFSNMRMAARVYPKGEGPRPPSPAQSGLPACLVVSNLALQGQLRRVGGAPQVPMKAERPAVLRLLKVARVRWHPDKVGGGDLAAKVRAEEVSKILNSWDTSGLR
jgi:hypothetical protein